jgi:hypothetical protein
MTRNANKLEMRKVRNACAEVDWVRNACAEVDWVRNACAEVDWVRNFCEMRIFANYEWLAL